MTTFITDDEDEAVRMARANYMACAYNAAVNYGSDRGPRKMGDLVRAINYYERTLGFVKLTRLVEAGVIEGFKPCGPECEMRPGGLFHGNDCENDGNHAVSKERTRAARMKLPGGEDGQAGWRAAYVSLVGSSR